METSTAKTSTAKTSTAKTSTAKTAGWISVAILTAALHASPPAEDPIVGIWEGRKVDGRSQTTEPWGPFAIERQADGSLAAEYLGSRLGQRDQPMHEVRLEGRRFQLHMNRWGGAILEAELIPGQGLVGELRHHGMVEDLQLERIANRSHRDILKLLESGGIVDAPPYQSEIVSVMIHHGADAARRIYEVVNAHQPERQLWGPSVVNTLGYELLNANRTAEAVEIFQLNALAYPEDANAFDSLGEGYLRNGDRQLAIDALRKSLTLRPRPDVRNNSIQLLKELGVDVYQ